MQTNDPIQHPPTSAASILVVDDSTSVLLVLESVLSSEGYDVHTCSNGSDAFALLHECPIDLILSDIVMPGMDGYGLQEKVRQTPQFSHMPFVFLTAVDDEEAVSKGKASGADDYLIKPPAPEELLSVVQGKLVRMRQQKQCSDDHFDRYRKRVISTLTHEFRTPMVPLQWGLGELAELLEGTGNEAGREILSLMQQGWDRLERLINDFMALQDINARLEQQEHDITGELTSLARIGTDCWECHRCQLEEQGFSLQCTDASQGATVRVNPSEIQDILARLIRNSVKFSGESRTIVIHARTFGTEAIIEVQDRGIGIDAVKVQEALEAFGQIDRETREQQGGGLGLALASGYATLQGGRLEFENRVDGGSVVRLVLPMINPGEQ